MIVMKIEGIDGLKRKMNKIQQNIKVAKQMTHELGLVAKRNAMNNIASAGAIATGNLLKSIHFRSEPDSATVWSAAGDNYDLSWEFGMKPHWIHRDMISEGGYSVGEWMDSHGMSPRTKFMFVGTGKIGTGIHFMENAYFQMLDEAPTIIDKYWRNVLK